MMIYFIVAIAVIFLFALYAMTEVMHYHKGHDVYKWTEKLVKWIDKK